MKNIVIAALAIALFFATGWFFGSRSTPACLESVPIIGTVPLDSMASAMTETRPDTIYVPKLVPVPGPARIVYLPDTMSGVPSVVPIDSVPPGPDRDAAVGAVVEDWNTKRRYTGTLFDEPRAGSATYDFTVQFNRAGAINYRFDPVPVVAAKPRRWGVGVQAGYGIITGESGGYIGIGLQYNLFTF